MFVNFYGVVLKPGTVVVTSHAVIKMHGIRDCWIAFDRSLCESISILRNCGCL